MENAIRDEFKDGKIWDNDIEYANTLIADYIRFRGGNDATVEDILDCIHGSNIPLNELDGDKILQIIEDYIDR